MPKSKQHNWTKAPRDWGCTYVLTRGPRAGEQCAEDAVVACTDRKHCDGQEGRCSKHIKVADLIR